jgi:hypothetical protein
MKLSKITATLALTAAAAVSVPATAVTITNLDGGLPNFGGFDWASGGAAWTNGLGAALNPGNFSGGSCNNLAACSFTINYVAWAGNLTDTGGGALSAGGLDANPNGSLDAGKKYEYTIKATLSATMVNFLPLFGVASYTVNAGTFSIYYDTTGNANLNGSGAGGWTGFNDGTLLIQGNLHSSTPQLFNLFNGSGNIALEGGVTFTNNTYIDTVLVGTQVSSTLQLWPSSQITSFTPPVSVDGVALPNVSPGGPEALFQADANQSFTTPEPTSMLLAGLALLGAGAASRRRRQG